MKKFAFVSGILALVLTVSCAFPTQAAQVETAPTVQETTQPPLATEETKITSDQGSDDYVLGTVAVEQGCRTIEGMIPLGDGEQLLDTADSAFLYEASTDTVIYSMNPDLSVPPGSMVKIVTAAVALQYCKLDDSVTVIPGIKSRLPVSRLTMNLTSDEVVTVRDLMHGLLLSGATDAAVVLAEHIAGTRQAFLPLMNQWVQEIGCTDTEFATVHGVDGGLSKTTARDMAKIVRAAIANEDFRTIFGTTEYEMGATNKSEPRKKWRTTNYMRDNGIVPQFYDTDVTGGFAGYEESSGACLVITTEYNNMHLIGVTMGSERVFTDTGNVQTYGNFEDMAEMLRFGYDRFKINRIVYDGLSMGPFLVSGGETSVVGQATVNVDSVVPIAAQTRNLTMSYNTDGVLTAPIQEGQKIATLRISYRNSCMTEVEVFAMGAVKPEGQTGVTIQSAATRNDGGVSGILSTIGTVCVIALGLVVVYLAYNSLMRARVRAKRRRRRESRRRTR